MDIMVLHANTIEGRITYLTNWKQYQEEKSQLEAYDNRYGTLWCRRREAYPLDKFTEDIVVSDVEEFVRRIT